MRMPKANRTTSIDIKVGNAVRIGRTRRSPNAGRLGVVAAIEPRDLYGPYIVEFEGCIFDMNVRNWNA